MKSVLACPSMTMVWSDRLICALGTTPCALRSLSGTRVHVPFWNVLPTLKAQQSERESHTRSLGLAPAGVVGTRPPKTIIPSDAGTAACAQRRPGVMGVMVLVTLAAPRVSGVHEAIFERFPA